jgi:O-antigen/teichoic acid export membrane protein
MTLMGRAGWGVADQILSSLTNFALSVILARAVGSAGLGSFTIVFTAYTTALGISRAATSEPLMVRFSAPPHLAWRDGTAQATGAALLAGVFLGCCCLAAAWLVGGPLDRPFMALGLTLPGLLVQDCWRYAFFARGQGFRAFANDLVWTLTLIPVLYALLRSDPDSMTWLAVLGWGGTATAAALFGAYQAGVLPAPRRALKWVRSEGHLIWRFMGEFAALGGAGQLIVYAIGVAAGLAALGAFRAGYILFGPIQVLYLGVSAIAVPELVRALETSGRRRLLWISRLLSITLISAVVLWGVVVLALPDSFGRAVLGEVWQPARLLASPIMVGWVGTALIAGAAAGLRALAAAGQSLRARLVGSVLAVAGGVSGALWDGARGAIYGLAIAAWVEASVWWWLYTRTMRRRQASGRGESVDMLRASGGENGFVSPALKE